MKSRISLVLCVLLAPCVPSAPRLWADANSSDVVDIIYFGKSRPHLIRLHIIMGGEPIHKLRSRFIRNYFNFLDLNDDQSLDREEALQVPLPDALTSLEAPIVKTMMGRRVRFSILDRSPRDGKLTLPEFQSFLDQHFETVRVVESNQELDNKKLDAILFDGLDSNKDEKLSNAELSAARKYLFQFDSNEDEIISYSELVPGEQYFIPALRRPPGTTNTIEHSSFLVVNKANFRLKFRTYLKNNYHADPMGRSANELKAEELAVDEEFYALLDQNKDRQLNYDETASWPTEPDAEASIRFDGQGTDHKLFVGGKAIQIQAPNARESWSRSAPAPEIPSKEYKDAFTKADANSDEQLDSGEMETSDHFRHIGAAMDRNRDGQLTFTEVKFYLGRSNILHNESLQSFLTMTISGERGLFKNMDADNSNSLTIRELMDFAQKAEQQFSREENTGAISILMSQGIQSGGPEFAMDMMSAEPPREQKIKLSSEWNAAPVWFRKMDRNRDGDVSPREFLGNAKDFAKVDKNDDGLISPKEAE